MEIAVEETVKTAAVLNRRANRAARTMVKRERQRLRHEHERLVAARMIARFFGNRPLQLITLDYRYWQARRCEWDPVADSFARNAMGRLCHPMESLAWYFWTRQVHPKAREQLVKMSPHRLRRAVP